MQTQLWTPESGQDAAEAARSSRSLRIEGLGTKRVFGCPVDADAVLTTRRLRGIVEWRPDDLVVTVRSGTPVADLQAELLEKGQCLPIPPWTDGLSYLASGAPGTVGGLVATRLPTRWDGWSRGVRYWVLGMRVLLASGETIQCGSKAVKNVAGYDLQKLFTGSWGSVGLILEVTLRVFPAARLSESISPKAPTPLNGRYAVVRTLASELESYLSANAASIERAMRCETTGTAWISLAEGAEMPIPTEGWIIRSHSEHSFPVLGGNVDIMHRIKDTLDPHRLWNPGVFGVL